ncbi:hypothetical protein LHU53_15620 [Rhodoferax sp. U2-2l]|uniref:hypothetical protein n=1 Tax=Rhodoferax sp. U2-2l TaxID=2884000 RepID=UPI001D0BE383|nr:hypothetical protein [Rhodoferax sp. U2-2l]MCB8748329.1 hypothetical protein [Rhodoferax sp. U2-2l]
MNRNLPNAREALFTLFVQATQAAQDMSDQHNKRAMALGNSLLREAKRLGYTNPEWVCNRIQSHLDEPENHYRKQDARRLVNELIAFVGAMTLLDMADKFEWTFVHTPIPEAENGAVLIEQTP